MTQAIIKETKRFSITIDGKEYHDFEKVGGWNGMVEYRNSQGVVITNEDNEGLDSVFAAIFSQEEKVETVDVVKCSTIFIGSE